LYKLLLWCEKASLKAAESVIVTNESYRRTILQRGHVAAKNIFIVRNSPNLKLFYPRAGNEKLKEGHRYMVSYIGIMGQQDGVDYLLRAAHHLRFVIGREDIFFIIMGTGDA